MAHARKTRKTGRSSRPHVSALLLLAIASLLIACGEGNTATWPTATTGGSTPPNPTPPPPGPTPPPPPPPPPPPGNPGDTTPPTSPANLAAAANGPFAADLSWQASTDAVGVTGYRVERCQGGGCSSFAQIASLNSTTFTDLGLTAATGYSYRVRATDAAANVSTPSNVASVTTGAPPPPGPGGLPGWVSALAVGAWFQIPNTAMDSVEPVPQPSGNTGPQSKVVAWTSFVVDTRTSKVYSLANGGHNDYAGNEVDVLDLETATPSWSQLLAPTQPAQLTNCQSYYSDGRPVSRHSYYGVTLNELEDRIMLFGGAHWCVNGGFHTAISSYNITSNNWSPSNTHGNMPGSFSGVAAYSRDPNTGDVYGVRGGSFARWTRSSNTVNASMNASGTPPPGDEAASAFDTTRGRILFLGNNSRHYYTLSSNSWAAVTITGANAANVTGGSNAMIYVPTLDSYLVRLDTSGGTVYQISASNFQATTFSTVGGSSIPATQNGPYNKFLYVPRLQGAVYVPSYGGNAWFLRLF
jgi:chitodextrinase